MLSYFHNLKEKNVNGLNAPIKTQTVADWIEKKGERAYNIPPPESNLRAKTHTQIQSMGIKIFHVNRNDKNHKKARVTIFISDKTDFKTKGIEKGKEDII